MFRETRNIKGREQGKGQQARQKDQHQYSDDSNTKGALYAPFTWDRRTGGFPLSHERHQPDSSSIQDTDSIPSSDEAEPSSKAEHSFQKRKQRYLPFSNRPVSPPWFSDDHILAADEAGPSNRAQYSFGTHVEDSEHGDQGTRDGNSNNSQDNLPQSSNFDQLAHQRMRNDNSTPSNPSTHEQPAPTDVPIPVPANESDISHIILSKESFAKIPNSIITFACERLNNIAKDAKGQSDVKIAKNKIRQNAVRLLREARDKKTTEEGYQLYLNVIALAQGDDSIIKAIRSIHEAYVEHMNEMDINKKNINNITLDEKSFAKISDDIIARVRQTLQSTTRHNNKNEKNRKKAISLLEEAIKNKNTDKGYQSYLQVINLAQDDKSIEYAIRSIYQGHTEQ